MVLIALGGNIPSHVGSPEQTMLWAIAEMTHYQIYVMSVSSFYCTKPLGQAGQPDYINGVVRARTSLSAANVLKNLKRIEKAAGRNIQMTRTSGRWASRPLDLDLVDYKSIVSANFHVCSSYIDVTCRDKSRRCDLVLPHPGAHLRPFVVRPILDINPFWHHPVNGLSARSLWNKMRFSPEGSVLYKLG